MTIFRKSPKLSPLPVVARHYACSTYSGVALCQSCRVSSFWRSNDVSVFAITKYFRFCRQLTSTVENVSLIVALGQILLSGCGANNVDLE